MAKTAVVSGTQPGMPPGGTPPRTPRRSCLDGKLLTQARGLPGVRAAVGIAPLNLGVTDPALEFLGGEAVSAGQLSQVLNLGVTSGSLFQLKPGQVAISTMEASNGMMGVHVGSPVTVYLPDGTPYRATVSAVYQRSLALGDLLVPASVAAGHTGTPPGYETSWSAVAASASSQPWPRPTRAPGWPAGPSTTPRSRAASARTATATTSSSA
jgi:hypothetical protein